LMVIATPLVQEKVAETLGLIAENTTLHDPILKIYKFREKLDSAFTATLQTFAPNAKLTLDTANRQLTVVAQPEDIDKIEAQLPTLVDSYADRDLKMIAYTAKGMALETLQSTIAGFHPSVTIKLDPAKKRLLIWGTAAEHAAIAEEIDKINAENDAGAYEGPKFVVYRMDSYQKSLQLTRVVKTMFPNAELIPDSQGQSMMIFATGEEHQQINEIIDQIDNPEDGNASVFDRFYRYQIKRAAPSLLTSTLAQVYPQLRVSVDSASNSLLIQGNPSSIEGVKQFLEMLDPEQPSPSDPTVVVYPLEHEPSSAALATLRLMAPNARIEVNSLNRSLVVVARPAEHKIIEETIRKIGGALEATEPVLAFYPYQTPPSAEMMSTLMSLAPTARITDLKDDKKLMVIALPLVQKKVSETLGLIAENTKENDPVLKIYTFREKLDSEFTTTLQTFAPNAKLTLDTANHQLTVVAQPEDIDKIEAQLPTLVDSYADRDRKMIAYTIKGMDLETLQSTLAGLYPNVTIKPDLFRKRLLIWGTAAEHATIAEEIDKINAEHQAGPYDGPKVVVYQVEDYRQSLQLTRIVKTMFPDAEVIPELTYYSSYSAREQSVTIFASQEEHQRIAELVDQLENPSNEGTLTHDTFSFGKLDPAAVESTLRAMLPAAVSGSPRTQRPSAPSTSSYYGQTSRQSFFRVDPDSRTVSVYAKPKDIERIREGIEGMSKAAEERPQVASKVFPLGSPIAVQLARPLQELLHHSTVTVSSPAELIVFGTTDDLAKAEEFLKGVDTTEGAGETRHFAPVTIPPDSLYPRASLIEQLVASFSPSGGYAYPGASGNQIVLYGTNRMIERMTEYLEACAAAKEKEYYQTYSVKNLSVAIVIDMLHRLCPNATITPNGQNRMITVFGSVFVQKQVEEALSQIDVQRTDGNEFEIRYYEIGSLPTSAYGHIYHIVYTYIISQTPQASMIPDIGGRQIVVVATRQEQEAIGQFVENTLKNFEANAPSLEVYRLKSVNLSTVSSVLQSVAPSVAIFPGKRSNEFFAWAIPSDHERLRQTLAQIESIDEDGPQGMVPKIYTLDKLGLELILPRLRESIPTAVVYPLAGNRVIVWGSDAEHRLAAELLGVVAEAFPEQTLAKYTPVHVPLTDLYYFIYRKYSPDAVVYLSETGDLVIRAPQALQEKIAGEIKQFDVPTAEEARPTAKAYDVSSIPTASLSSVIPNILRVVPEAIFLPTQTPGYFVIYARPEAQKKVAGLVAEIVKVQPWLKTRTERYTLKNLSQVGAIELLRPLAPAAVMVPGIEHNQLIVSDKEEEYERIAEALEKAAGQGEGNLVNRIYHL
ncbi:MAG: hypothetical protein J6S75_01800, partial [Thermoguttaceae bacterium]|nr:hypothetical protein [Thermoguttaceae bacterium]